MSTSSQTTPGRFAQHAAEVASFYGFKPARELDRRARSFATTLTAAVNLGSKAPSDPVLAFYATPSPAHLPAPLRSRDTAEFGLQVVGSSESLSDVFLIKTLFVILREWTTEGVRVQLNAPGDRDSRARFERELAWYLRKHVARLCPGCQTHLTAAPLSLYNCSNEGCRDLLTEGPRVVNFLSERSRAHFRAVLERLEALGLPYELNDLLMNDDREARITFAFSLPSEGAILAIRGGRYDDHIRSLTGKKDATGVCASVFFRKRGIERSSLTAPTSSLIPKLYFVQLGPRAKLQGFGVLDTLRQAKIPVGQCFDARGLAIQLQNANALGVSYLIIMGEREALDGTVIVRRVANSAQTTVPLLTLPRYLKALRV